MGTDNDPFADARSVIDVDKGANAGAGVNPGTFFDECAGVNARRSRWPHVGRPPLREARKVQIGVVADDGGAPCCSHFALREADDHASGLRGRQLSRVFGIREKTDAVALCQWQRCNASYQGVAGTHQFTAELGHQFVQSDLELAGRSHLSGSRFICQLRRC